MTKTTSSNLQQARHKISRRVGRTNRQVRYLIGWFGLGFTLLMIAVLRVPLLSVALERDEGEYAYIAQLLLKGIWPYTEAYSMKLPGIYASYAAIISVFGHSHVGVHLGLLFVNWITATLLFFLAKRIAGPLAGFATAACFAMTTMAISVQGIFANAEHFVLPWVIAGMLLLLVGQSKQSLKQIAFGGLCIGLGFLNKQHGAAFMLGGGVYLLVDLLRSKQVKTKQMFTTLIVYSVAALAPFGLVCLAYKLNGHFDDFWFWTITYGQKYATSTPLSTGKFLLSHALPPIIKSNPGVWFLAIIGVVASLTDRRLKRHNLFIWLYVLFSIVAVCPGLFFRPHYFILLMPAVSLLAGLGAASLDGFAREQRWRHGRYAIPIVVTISVVSLSLYIQRQVLFQSSPTEITKQVYGENPFVESLEVAAYLRAHTTSEDKIAVWGSEPQLFFYSGRKSATSFMYTYEMVKNHRFARQMQQTFIKQIVKQKPAYLVAVNMRYSWGRLPLPQEPLSLSMSAIIREHYEFERAMPLLRHQVTRLSSNAVGQPKAWFKPNQLVIYRRKN